MTFNLTPFLTAYENFLKGANNAADALALPVNGTALEGEFNVTNSAAFLASFGKYLQFHFKTVEDLANKFHVPGFDALSYGANLSKLQDSGNENNQRDALIAVIGDIASIIGGVVANETGGAAAAAAMGFTLGSTFILVAGTVGIVASVYSTFNDIQKYDQINSIKAFAFNTLEDFDDFTNSSSGWKGFQAEIYNDYFKTNPATLPAMLISHLVDKNTLPADVLSFIENSGISTTFSGGRIDEVSQYLRSLNKLLFGVDTPDLTSEAQIIDFVDTVYQSYRDNPIAGNVQLVNVADSAVDQSTIWEDFSSFLTLVYLTPFTLKALNQQAEDDLKFVHQDVATAWETDRQLSAQQLANGEGIYSEQWVTDRIAMLGALHTANLEESNTLTSGSMGQGSKHFLDIATGKEVTIINIGDIQQIIFGDSGDNVLPEGGSQADHLYGGGGFDLLRGNGGNDYMEGGTDGDILEGGAGNDKLLGGTGGDTLTGGSGDDTLIGGEGNDTYIYHEGDGFDTIVDSDGTGKIQWGDLEIKGSNTDGLDPTKWQKHGDTFWSDETNHITYSLITQPDGSKDLHINKEGDEIEVKDWQPGNLGINLGEGADPLPAIYTYNGDQRAPLTGDSGQQTYNWGATTWTPGGFLIAGIDQENFNDVIYGDQHAAYDKDTLNGFGGNDSLDGGTGDDKIDGGEGDDLLAGGIGSDTIKGGAGNDYILSAVSLSTLSSYEPHRSRPGETLQAPGGNTAWIEGSTWGVTDESIGIGNDTVQHGFGDPYFGQYADDDSELQDAYYFDQSVSQDTAPDVVLAGDGDDQAITGLGDDYIDGGLGNDALAGHGGNDIIDGGDGDDLIIGDGNSDQGSYFTLPDENHGNDTLYGGVGSDSLIGGGKDDKLFGGSGNDLIIGDGISDQGTFITVPDENHGDDTLYGDAGSDSLIGGGKDDNLFGGSGDDLLRGDAFSNMPISGQYHGYDYLDGGDGNDILIGGGKDDVLIGGAGDDGLHGDLTLDFDVGIDSQYQGNDYLDGGEGNDLLSGNGGNDTLLGGIGDDILSGGVGNDFLDGGTGKDILGGGVGSDSLLGGSGVDLLNGDEGNDYLDGGDGDDLSSANGNTAGDGGLAGGAGDDTILGGAGRDELDGGDDNDALDGGTGDDLLFGGAGNDTLLGGTGVDLLLGDEGNDYLDGGDGDDLSSANGNTAGDGGLAGGAGDDTILGGAGKDELDGGEGSDSLDGGTGDDLLFGGAGNDTLIGGAGTDYFDGGAGDDTYQDLTAIDVIFDNQGNDTLVLQGAGGLAATQTLSKTGNSSLAVKLDNGETLNLLNVFYGTHYNLKFGNDPLIDLESLIGNTFTTALSLGLGNSGGHLYGGAANDLLQGGSGDDTISGHLGNDNLYGLYGNDTLNGGEGDDYLDGGYSGNDILNGAVGNDRLYGLNGNDVLNGGTGNDTLNGGEGSDIYLFDQGWGQDILNDPDYYTADIDAIQFGTGISAADIQVTGTGTGIILSYIGTTDKITLNNFDYSNLIDEIQFADGTKWDLATIKAQATLGSSFDDFIYGFSTADTLDGLGGNDYLFGRAGNDLLKGGADDDWLLGEDGDDVLEGGVGNDIVDGGWGSDTYLFDRGWGYDSIRNYDTGSFKTDVIQFAAGISTSDISVTRSGNTLILTLAGTSDTLEVQQYFVADATGDYKVEEIRFADGTTWNIDTVKAKAILGTGSDDNIYGYESDDTMSGLGGNDTLYGLGGNDTLDGGAGDDVIYGYDGDDLLVGGTGNDTLEGHDGADIYMFDRGWGQDTVWDHSQDTQIDVIQFGAGITAADIQVKHVYDNLTFALIGTTDVIQVNYYFSAENNKINEVHFSDGTVWDIDTIEAMARLGTNADDWLYGSGFDDTINGLGGNDSLIGFGGNDLLNGGAGNDELIGGEGSDIYFFERGWGFDDVSNSDTGLGVSDVIQFAADISASDIQVSRSYDALILNLIGTTDKIAVKFYFAGNEVDEIRFADGTVWDIATIEAKVKIASGADDTLYGTESADTLDGLGGNDDLIGLGGNDSLIGSEGDDYLYGNSGADILTGGIGKDNLNGGEGSDTYLFDQGWGQDTIWSEDNSTGKTDVIQFASGISADNIQVTRLTDEHLVLTRIGTTDTVLIINIFSVYVPGNYKIEEIRFADGTVWDLPTIEAKANTVDHNAAETLVDFDSTNYLDGLGGDDFLFGLSDNDTLNGGDGDDKLDGGTGADNMLGGVGNDNYVVDNSLDLVTEAPNEGIDSVQSSITYTLSNNVENLSLTGTTVINGKGNSLNNVLTGSTAANTLDGGTGADTMIGGMGDDTYVVDNTLDVVTEALNEGIDSVQSKVTYTLSANLENLTLTNSSVINGTGNDLDNILTGNSAANNLTGAAGNDRLVGGIGNDTMKGGVGNDTYVVDVTTDVITELANEGTDTVESGITFNFSAISNVENLTLTGSSAINGTGNTLNNLLTGNSAANTLSGGTGNDILIGGAGNDIYVVDSTLDVVTELLTEGTDLVQSSVTYTLSANLENLTLTASALINGTGNTLDNILTGNGVANTLTGDAGNDRLIGGVGNDTLKGGIGDDVYVIDVTTDIITENLNEGTDTIESGITFAMTAISNVENLLLTGSSVINGTGNALDNVLTGNTAANTLTGAAGNDRLIGGAGNDTMKGGLGNDTYVIDVTTDIITELANEGTDTVESGITFSLTAANVENLTLTGSAAINGTGNALNNIVIGNAGINTLNGVAGNDTLTGGAGADNFLFDAALNATTNKDVIADFNVVDDTIRLENAIFTKFTAVGALPAGSFVSGANAVALDSNDYLIYNTSTGTLSYDADGNGVGAKVDFVVLTGNPALTVADFAVI